MSIADTFKLTTINLIKKTNNTTKLEHDIDLFDNEKYIQELYEKELLKICRKQIDNLEFYYDFPWILNDKIIELFKKDGFNVKIIKNEYLLCEHCLGKTCYFCEKGNTTRIEWA